MKAYIYKYVGGLTANYHDGGGAVVITDGDPLVLLNAEAKLQHAGYDDEDFETITDAADLVLDVSGYSGDKVFVFPDAGCC